MPLRLVPTVPVGLLALSVLVLGGCTIGAPMEPGPAEKAPSGWLDESHPAPVREGLRSVLMLSTGSGNRVTHL